MFPANERAGWRPKEFQARLGISGATFWRWVRKGKIRVVREGRVVLVPVEEETRLLKGAER